MYSLVPRLHSPAFYRAFIYSAIKSWGVEPGSEAMSVHVHARIETGNERLGMRLGMRDWE